MPHADRGCSRNAGETQLQTRAEGKVLKDTSLASGAGGNLTGPGMPSRHLTAAAAAVLPPDSLHPAPPPPPAKCGSQERCSSIDPGTLSHAVHRGKAGSQWSHEKLGLDPSSLLGFIPK